MKHLTLIPVDNQVYIDRVCMIVDLSDMAKNIHAVQWSEEYQTGEIEYVNDPYAPQDKYKPNERIKSREPFQKYVDGWHVSKKAWDEEQARQAEQQKEMAAMLERIQQEQKNAQSSTS